MNDETAMADLRAALTIWLTERWGPCEITDFSPVTAGARRTNVLFDARVGTEIRPLVLTLVPSEEMMANPLAVETGLLKIARAGGVPVAEVHETCLDPGPLGGPFFVTSRIDGETIPRRILRLCDATPGLGRTLAEDCGAALAQLHRVDPAAVQALGLDAPDSSTRAALDHLDGLMDQLLQPSLPFELVRRWLERHRPSDTPPVPIHGDVRNGNIVVSKSGLAAILDWEIGRLGDPFQDLAWMAQRMWRGGNDSREIGGFADRPALRMGYERAGGLWDNERFDWWKVERTLWWGLALAGQARSHLDGSFSSIVMAASGRRVAELEWDALQLISPNHRPLSPAR